MGRRIDTGRGDSHTPARVSRCQGTRAAMFDHADLEAVQCGGFLQRRNLNTLKTHRYGLYNLCKL